MLRVENLSKTFGKKEVLHNVDLEINEKERIVIIGPSGCGKSTLLRTINMIEEPTKGKIYFNDELITKDNINDLRNNTGLVFQSFNLFSNLCVIDNITLSPIVNKIMSKDEANKKAKEYLKTFGLLDKAKEKISNLSGGQMQRVAIIRALILNPKLILFDEPTSALDPENKKESLNLIKELAKTGIAVVVVTHDVNFIKDFATRIIFMKDGKIVIDDETEKVLTNKNEDLKEFINEIV